MSRALNDDLVYMLVMWRGNAPIGIVASFVDWNQSRLLFFVGGRDPDYNDLPVGLLLHAHSIRWAIQNGIRTYDFLRGNEAYKYSLGAADARLKYPLVRTKSGLNLNGQLDPASVGEALQIAERFAKDGRRDEAVTACDQVLGIPVRRSRASATPF